MPTKPFPRRHERRPSPLRWLGAVSRAEAAIGVRARRVSFTELTENLPARTKRRKALAPNREPRISPAPVSLRARLTIRQKFLSEISRLATPRIGALLPGRSGTGESFTASSSGPRARSVVPKLARGDHLSLRGARLMTERVPLPRNVLAAEVFLGSQGVVRAATQGEVGCEVGSASCEGLQVVKLEVARLAATLSVRIDVTAASAVALEHFASLGCGDGGNVNSSPCPSLHPRFMSS